MAKKKMTAEAREAAKSRLKSALMDHVGRGRKVGMGELYEAVFDEAWSHRINDTRALRKLVSELRREGLRVCSDTGGYWLAATDSELGDYLGRQHERAIRILAMEARIRRVSMPKLLGQMALEFDQAGAA